jgi:hypothetical protein
MPQLIFRPEPFEGFMEFDEWEAGSDYEFEEEISRTSPDYIRWVQQSLNQVMGLQLAVDGVDGPKTRSAIRSFQQQRGLTADGIVGPVTEAAMRAAGAPPPPGSVGGGTGTTAPCTPAQRKTPAYIRWVQESLNAALPTNLVVDGIKGPKTTAGVVAFQQRNGLQVDGIVGPQTEGALIKATGKLPPGCGGTVPPLKGCPPHKARVRIHVKILQQPNVSISTMISNMQSVYGPSGFLVEVASTETLNAPSLVDLDLGPPATACGSTNATSTEQVQLFQNRNNVGADEVVVYFVRSTSPPFNGCASHPVGRPGAVVVQTASQWTLAHEVGHVLGLNHVNNNDRLMTSNGTFNITNPPPDLVAPEVTTMDISPLTINC